MTDMNTPQLTDRTALARNRRRATPDALFLLETAADEIEERLIEVNRSFKSVAIIAGFPHFWVARYPDATIIVDDDMLDLDAGCYDLVLHMMCLHWANDPVGQLVQCRHALKPDGLLLCMAFGGQTLHELRASLAEAETKVTGGLSPRVAPMGEIRDLGALLQRAGYALPVADGTSLTVSYADAFQLMQDLRRMGEANALTQRVKQPTRRNMMTEAASIYASNFGNANNRIDATFEIITLTGWAPAETQQKPLRPGSAKTRLADALGTIEAPLNRSND